MGKPRMIILIRHAQSEGNKNRDIHQSIPDHRVKLTPEGHRQACDAGSRLRSLLNPDDTLHFFTSPYRRTRETTEGILESLTSDSPSPSPFPRHTITVYEEPRLREQDFGNFQPCSAEMERMWLERADYGHFFYRIPNGESAADAYDRVSGFNESLWRLFGEDDFASVCILVTHGLMTRVFLTKWYHWSVEYFEDLRNINHCEFVVLKLNPDNGKYVLQNQMRTWSDLKKQKELERNLEHTAKGLAPPPPQSSGDSHIPIRRRWGGCPDGCNHGIPRRPSRTAKANPIDTHRQENDNTNKKQIGTTEHYIAQDTIKQVLSSTTQLEQQQPIHTQVILDPGLGDHPTETLSMDGSSSSPDQTPHHISVESRLRPKTNLQPGPSTSQPHPVSNPAISRRPNLSNFHRDTEDHLLHLPRSKFPLLHLGGRDGGGSLSGANSLAPSEDEHDEISPPKSIPTTTLPFRSRGGSLHHHHPRPSQDLANDGDDEGSGSQMQQQRLRRSRSHHHHHHNHNHHPQTNTSRQYTSMPNPDEEEKRNDIIGNHEGDFSDVELGVEGEYEHEHQHDGDHEEEDDDDDAIKAERQREESIMGSVY